MPSSQTITAFNSFTANTLIRSSQVNENFSVFRGHLLPVNTDTATSSDATHDLGAPTHRWMNMYGNVIVLTGQSTPALNPTTGQFKIYPKSDGNLYRLNSSGSESQIGGGPLTTKGDLMVHDGSASVRIPIGSNDQVLTADSSATAGLKWATPGAASTFSENYADNAQFRFFQRQDPNSAAAYANDAYCADRWYILTSNGNINVTRGTVSDTTFTTKYSCTLTQANSTATQFGIAQIKEAKDVRSLRGEQVTFNFAYNSSGGTITTIRAGIIEWTGSEDAVTSSLVSSWSTTPALVAGAAFLNTPSALTVGASLTSTSITVTVGASMNNLILFIYTQGTEAQNDSLDIKEVQLIRGSSAQNFSLIEDSYADDLQRCQRYYEKSYDVDVKPGASATAQGVSTITAPRAYTKDGLNAIWSTRFQVPKFTTPFWSSIH